MAAHIKVASGILWPAGITHFIPLTTNYVITVGAALRAAGFRSGAQYISGMETLHAEDNHVLTPAMELVFRKVEVSPLKEELDQQTKRRR